MALSGERLCCAIALLLAAGLPQAHAVAAETGVRDMLQRYSAALESLDANAVKKVQPSIPADNLAKAFKDMRELKVAIDAVRVLSIDGTTARVSCRVTQTLTPRAGSQANHGRHPGDAAASDGRLECLNPGGSVGHRWVREVTGGSFACTRKDPQIMGGIVEGLLLGRFQPKWSWQTSCIFTRQRA